MKNLNKKNNNNISDLMKLQDKLYETISDYIEEMDLFNEDVYLIVNIKTLDVSYDLFSDDKENDYYPIQDYIIDEYEPNSDAIQDIASSYIFVR